MKTPLPVVAGLLAVAAVVLSLHVALSAPAYRERLGRRLADLRAVESIAAERQAVLSRIAGRASAGDAEIAAALADAATETLGLDVASITLDAPADLAPLPAVLRTANVRIADAPYAEIAVFLDHAADATPAWHLRSASFEPSAEAGRGAASLVLQTL